MWMAKDWCFCESWGILPCWSSFCNPLDFCILLWRKGKKEFLMLLLLINFGCGYLGCILGFDVGTLDGNHRWERHPSITFHLYCHAYKLGSRGTNIHYYNNLDYIDKVFTTKSISNPYKYTTLILIHLTIPLIYNLPFKSLQPIQPSY